MVEDLLLQKERKKAILTTFKRQKRPIRPNKRLHFTMFSRLCEQQTETSTTKHVIMKNLYVYLEKYNAYSLGSLHLIIQEAVN